jgi:hypothetical protein
MKALKVLAVFVVAAIAFSSCTTISHSMKEPGNYVEFKKDDFEFSKQVSGEATQVKLLQFLDVSRIFYKELGETVSPGGGFQIPIIGGMLAKKVNMFALYNVMKDNPGYDVVFYPQFETKVVNVILVKTTKVKVTCRLGKVK